MFISVKDLCIVMDNYISYVLDARETNKSTPEYEQDMQKKLTNQLIKLKSISSNKKLISKYEFAINKLFG